MDHNDTKLLFENWNKFVEGLQQIDEAPPRFVRTPRTRPRASKIKSTKGSAGTVDDLTGATKVTGPTGRRKPSRAKIPGRFEKFNAGDLLKLNKNNEIVPVSPSANAHLENAAQAALEAVEGLAQRGAKVADELKSLPKTDDIEIDTLLNRIRTAKFHGLANSIRKNPEVSAAILIGALGVGAQQAKVKLMQYYNENLRLINDVEIIPYIISQEIQRLDQAKTEYKKGSANQEAYKAMVNSRDRILGLVEKVDQMKKQERQILLNAQKLISASERKIKQELKVPTSPEDLPDPPTDVELTDSDIDNVAFEMGLDPERIAPREPDEVPYRTGRRLEEPAKKKPKIKVNKRNRQDARKKLSDRLGGF